MQSENSNSLKAGSTKNKQSAKGGVTSHVRYNAYYAAKKGIEISRRPLVGQKQANLRKTAT
jgi:hypothetical protein